MEQAEPVMTDDLNAHPTPDADEPAQASLSDLGGQVREQVTTAAQAQKDNMADTLEQAAQTLHETREKFSNNQGLAGLIERGADELGSLALTFRQNDLAGLTGRLENLARQQPALFAGLAIAAGFAATRLARAAVAGGEGA